MSRLDNCLTAIVGDKLPIETARKTFFFLLGIAVMLIVIALPSPSPFYKGEEAIPLTANAKIVMAVLCFAGHPVDDRSHPLSRYVPLPDRVPAYLGRGELRQARYIGLRQQRTAVPLGAMAFPRP